MYEKVKTAASVLAGVVIVQLAVDVQPRNLQAQQCVADGSMDACWECFNEVWVRAWDIGTCPGRLSLVGVGRDSPSGWRIV